MQQFAIAGAASVRPFNPILSVQHSRKNILTGADFKQPRMKSLLEKLWDFETTRPSMRFTDNWSDEEFIRQMKELIGNEGDIHVTCNHSEGEQVTETHVHAESSLVSP
ncbi:hypothetical protein [Escherichia coli]|uniref:hypothetical protein n=1 Tax=Escherichia coli TaxID=562 RepID=UPI0015964DD2|nr:hypothetical protein [Escherichia coli]